MRINARGLIALDDRGAAVAHWRDLTTEVYQQPVIPTDPDGPWQVVQRESGDVSLVATGGANVLCASGGEWMRRLDGMTPALSGSRGWTPTDGYPGDMDGGIAITVDSESRLLRVFAAGIAVHDIARGVPFGGLRLKGRLAAWVEFPGPRLVVHDVVADVRLPVVTVDDTAHYTALAFDAPSGVWVIYQTDRLGLVCHRADDASQGYQMGLPESVYDPDVLVTGAGVTIGWCHDPGQMQPALKTIPTLGVGMTVFPVPVPVRPFGPVSGPMPEGTVINFRRFIPSDPALQPRLGPSHKMQQVPMADGRICFLKFGQPSLGELWSLDADDNGWVHHLRDYASLTESNAFEADTRWLMIRMAIGRAGGFTSSDHEVVYRTGACTVTNRVPFRREMWIASGWERFWCGPDLGERRVVRVVYDSTAGAWSPDRYVETYYFAEGAGWISWTTDPSSVVYATGQPVLPNPPMLQNSFYLVGGPSVTPRLSGCIAVPVIPSEPVMNLPADIYARIVRFAEGYPIPQGPPGDAHENRCRVWMRCCSEQIRSEFGPNYGTKGSGVGSPQTKDVLAYRDGATFGGWDILTGAGTGAPRLVADPSWINLAGQEFRAVAPINRLTRASAHSSGLPSRWVGLSSFDVGTRLRLGDARWLSDPEVKRCNILRVMVSRQSGPTPRSLETGRAELRALLPRLAANGQRANVVLLCDTKDYDRATMTEHVRLCDAILLNHADAVALVELGNELGHESQSPDLMDIDYLESLAALIDPMFPLAWGGEFEGGSIVTLHTDRSQTPEENGAALAARQMRARKPVIDDEPLGIGEVAIPGRRTDDPVYAQQLARVGTVRGYRVTLHLEAGLSARVEDLGPVQRQALVLFAAEYSPVDPPVPPTGHPILDAPLTPALPVGYLFWIANRPAIEREAVAWYTRAAGHAPAESDISHGLWRALYEGERWLTCRAAWRNTWPGGEP